jgi:hypothetical protein
VSQRGNDDQVEPDDVAPADIADGIADGIADRATDDPEHVEPADDEPTEFVPADAASADDVVANARRRYGGVGAVLAASMLAVDNLLREKQKPDSVQIQEAASEPIDVDEHGIQMIIDPTTSVTAPPLARRAPVISTARRRRR